MYCGSTATCVPVGLPQRGREESKRGEVTVRGAKHLALIAVLGLTSLVMLAGTPALAHGSCEVRHTTETGSALGATAPVQLSGFQVADSGNPFVFNGVRCDEQHKTFSVTVRLGRYNDNTNLWVTKDTSNKTCSTGFSCYASGVSAPCSSGDQALWRVRVTSSIGVDATHTPSDVGGPVFLTCNH
jgi:hypothetical protein